MDWGVLVFKQTITQNKTKQLRERVWWFPASSVLNSIRFVCSKCWKCWNHLEPEPCSHLWSAGEIFFGRNFEAIRPGFPSARVRISKSVHDFFSQNTHDTHLAGKFWYQMVSYWLCIKIDKFTSSMLPAAWPKLRSNPSGRPTNQTNGLWIPKYLGEQPAALHKAPWCC